MNIPAFMHTQNDCYKAKKKIGEIKGIVVHSTGAVNPELRRYIQPTPGCTSYAYFMSKIGKNKYSNDWNRPGTNKEVHAFIGKEADGTVSVWQVHPFSFACWGCGSGKNGSYNYSPNGHIQFEICEGKSSDSAYFEKAYAIAVKFCAEMVRRCGFPVSEIVGHGEAHDKGYASDHGDPDSYFKKFGKSMDTFRADVEKELNPVVSFSAGDKVIVNGTAYNYASGEGTAYLIKNKTMYIVNIVDEKKYRYNYGVAYKKGGIRFAWVDQKTIKRG